MIFIVLSFPHLSHFWTSRLDAPYLWGTERTSQSTLGKKFRLLHPGSSVQYWPNNTKSMNEESAIMG